MARIYAVPVDPQPFVSKLCWGSCGRGHVGAIMIGVMGCIPCGEEQCPHLDREMELPGADVDGSPVWLRRLLDPTDAP